MSGRDATGPGATGTGGETDGDADRPGELRRDGAGGDAVPPVGTDGGDENEDGPGGARRDGGGGDVGRRGGSGGGGSGVDADGPHERAYVDRRMADAELADEAAARAAGHWGLGAPGLLRRSMNAIYRSGDVVLRVATPSAPAGNSLELARLLDRVGIPVPVPVRHDVVRHGGASVTAWPYVEASGEPIDWSAVGMVVRRVHDLAAVALPTGLPTPSPVVFPWWDFGSLIADVADQVDEPAIDGIRSTVERFAGWDRFDEVVVCHGDVHPGNVIQTEGGPVLLDWDLLCLAPRGWDHAPLMTWTERWGGEPGIYEAFADGYGWSARDDRSAEAFAELRLVAAALMRVRAGLADPSARAEAQRRLAYFRGDPHAPTWRAS